MSFRLTSQNLKTMLSEDLLYKQAKGSPYVTIEFWPTPSEATSLVQPQPLQQSAKNSQGLVSEWQLPYFSSLLPTQDQPQKDKHAL